MKFWFPLLFLSLSATAQFSAGIGIYPTGTEPGVGLRLSKNSKVTLDARLARVNFFSDHARATTCITEVSAICRVVKLEKVRFHVGVGYKMEYNSLERNKNGLVIPLGVEAFPFPFQNAGVFFEIAPYGLTDPLKNYYAGIRTVAGFVFYFLKKNTETTDVKN